MNAVTVVDELADKLDAITGLRVYRFPVDQVVAPAAIFGYPDIEFDHSYGRGVDRMTVPVMVLIDRTWDRSTYERFSDLTAGSGAGSIKQAIQAGPNVAYSTARASSVAFSAVSAAGLEYWAATFSVDVTGPGSS